MFASAFGFVFNDLIVLLGDLENGVDVVLVDH